MQQLEDDAAEIEPDGLAELVGVSEVQLAVGVLHAATSDVSYHLESKVAMRRLGLMKR